jgi:DNA-binding GntR family transcriptional regulator
MDGPPASDGINKVYSISLTVKHPAFAMAREPTSAWLGDSSAEMRCEHQELIERLRTGDTAGAARCLQAQIETSRDRVLHALARAPREELPP